MGSCGQPTRLAEQTIPIVVGEQLPEAPAHPAHDLADVVGAEPEVVGHRVRRRRIAVGLLQQELAHDALVAGGGGEGQGLAQQAEPGVAGPAGRTDRTRRARRVVELVDGARSSSGARSSATRSISSSTDAWPISRTTAAWMALRAHTQGGAPSGSHEPARSRISNAAVWTRPWTSSRVAQQVVAAVAAELGPHRAGQVVAELGDEGEHGALVALGHGRHERDQADALAVGSALRRSSVGRGCR